MAEPPFSHDVPNGPTLEERQNRARSEFQNLDTNRNGFVERAEAEALVHSEFNQYDTDRDNKATEPEVRLIVQRSLAREAAERQQIEARRRQGMTALNDFIDMQLQRGRQARQEQRRQVGSDRNTSPWRGRPTGRRPRACCPIDIRQQLVMRKFQEIDTNKDGQLDRVEADRPMRSSNSSRLTPTRTASSTRKSSSRRRKPTSKKMREHHPGRCSRRRPRGRRRRRQPALPGQPAPAPAAAGPGARPAAAHALGPSGRYSTVTLLARLRGWSTSVPLATAV